MALMLIPQQPSDQKPRNSFVDKKPTTLQLKDYLQDDFGSCSSNGFRSFPRRQCCAAAARNLIDLDSSSRSSHHHHHEVITSSKRFIRKMSRSKSTSTKITSALHRASIAVINAVKLLPFRSSLTNTNSLSQNKSSTKKKSSSSILMPRTLSRRLFSSRSTFWRRSSNSNLNTTYHDQIIISSSSARSANVGDDDRSEIEKWISSAGKYVDHHSTTTSLSIATVTTTTTATTTTTESSNTSDDSWSESDSVFALITPHVDAVHQTKIESGTTDGCGDGVIETVTMKNNWDNVKDQEKEQLSPVSVLDFPDYYCYDYKQESSTSPFSPSRRFGCLSNLHPVNLESMLSLSADDDDDDDDDQLLEQQHQTTTTDDHYDHEEYFINSASLTIDQERFLEQIIKDKNSSMSLTLRCEFVNLLLSFFEEGMERASISRVTSVEEALMKEAEDWLRGTSEINKLSQQGWNDEEMRGVYVEQGGDWRCVIEEKDEIVVDLEGQLLVSLVDELVVQIMAGRF